MDWFNSILIEEIPSEKMRDVAYRNGINDAISLMRFLPGVRLYIPNYSKKKSQFDYVKKHYNGKNVMSVAVHLKIDTERVKYLAKAQGYDKDILSNNYISNVAERCGEDIANRLLDNFGGDYIYIPSNGFSSVRRKRIIEEFNGSNSLVLALKYKVSERYISKVMAENYSQNNVVQMDLFS